MIVSSSSRSDIFAKPWQGFRSWFVSSLACIAIFEFLALFAWKVESERVIDLTIGMIGIPAGAFAIIVCIAMLWAGFGSVSLGNALAFVTRFLPIAWAIPLFDIIRTYGNGVILGPPKLNGLSYVYASLTGGVLPITSGIPIGMRLGMFLGACGVGIVAWQVSRRWWKGIVSGLIVSAVFISLISSFSFLAISRSPFSVESWTAKSVEITRRATMVLSQGYWWNSAYDRFPSAVDGQTDVAIRLAAAGSAVFILGFVLLLAFFLFQKARWRMFKRFFITLPAAEMLVALGLGAGCAWSVLSRQTKGWTFFIASAVAVLIVLALRVSSALRSDLATSIEQGEDSRRGDLGVESARSIASGAEWYAVAGAWVLGWPIVISVIVALAASALSRDRNWMAWPVFKPVSNAIGLSAIAAISFFFLSQKAVMSTGLLAAILAAFLFSCAMSWVWQKIAVK